MRQLVIAVLLLLGFVEVAPRRAEATEVTIEVRHTPPLVRPDKVPSLCAILALSLSEHVWAGAGYEWIQDYDAILWTSETEGHKPIVMSGIRAGAWYRGGGAERAFTWAAGPLLTFANPAFSIAHSPGTLDSGTSVFDFGVDFSIGHVWQSVRVEGFATPAWSLGRVTSPAVHKEERYNAFTYRFGVALAVLVGS
ncbi:MAG TPA: hypothetical protein VF524_08655 [Polyangia bacterium]